MLKGHKIVVEHGFETSFWLDTDNSGKVFDIQGVRGKETFSEIGVSNRMKNIPYRQAS